MMLVKVYGSKGNELNKVVVNDDCTNLSVMKKVNKMIGSK